MRIAVLITGQPRYLEEGAWWFKNRVFPESSGVDVDYYGYFWDDGDPNLENRIQQTYGPIQYQIGNYDNAIDQFINSVQERNNKIDDWHNIPEKYKHSFLFGVEKQYISDYSKQIWGQYLCSDRIANMCSELNDYDVIIRTRSDVAFNNMPFKFWHESFANMYRNPIFNDKMFAPWLYVDSGMPLFADFAFISKPKVWHNFNKNIEENCIRLATENKALWYELGISDFYHVPHWIWNKLAMYSGTSMLSYSVVWPMPFDCKLFRYNENVQNINFDHINNQFSRFSQEHD